MLRKNRRPLRLERLEDRVTPTGNILILTHSGGNYVIEEVTQSGALVRTLTPPSSGGAEWPKDMIVAPNGDIDVFNGTFTPYLSTWHAASGTWTSLTTANWSTPNVGGLAGVACWGSYAY